MDFETTQNSAHPSRSTTPDQETIEEAVMADEQEFIQPSEAETPLNDLKPESSSSEAIIQINPLIHGIPEALSNKISKLLTAEQLVVIQTMFRDHLPSTAGNPEIPVHDCLILKRIPIECRKQIWEYLLCNPLLGECLAADNNRASFGLFPAILRANRQAYNECMDILYGSNTFLIECIPHESFGFGSGRVTFCALTRSQQLDRADGDGQGDDSIIPAAKHVQHWKVVLSAKIADPNTDNGLLSFCRNIRMATIQSLEVLIVPRGVERDWELEYTYGDESQLVITLSPLECLRNIQRFAIRSAEFHEIPNVAFTSGESLAGEFIPILPDPVDEVRLVNLIQGNSEVERIEEMYKSLLVYAQAFERIEEFKLDMDIDDQEIKDSNFDITEYCTKFFMSSNPFKYSNHPVEVKVSAAKAAMMGEDMEKLKLNRSIVIRYLEPQYQAIEAAFKNLVEFIKTEKTKGCLFAPHHEFHKNCVDTATKAIVLLEDYAASFTRTLEPATKFAIRKQKLLFNTRYEGLPREQAMKLCDMAYEKQWWCRFVDNYKEAVDDMDIQYLTIREARKKLYAGDLKSTVREVDINSIPVHEMIHWDAPEGDESINEEDREYHSDSEKDAATSTRSEGSEAGD
ncbi:hypothetical protein MFRU_012g01430 [Monilinia fructicola]|uniref:Uncharacterized protein n=1 Tax=Monilinia fructicola TaxID=38448 RepID=A0A5M9JKV2_MONFR|nr:hypothetical protein EYC84_007615 [Monilinia fructicola]KAG4030408.1 hypothetical protein MFRU_012g01430 [Monilinia fructicola]